MVGEAGDDEKRVNLLQFEEFRRRILASEMEFLRQVTDCKI